MKPPADGCSPLDTLAPEAIPDGVSIFLDSGDQRGDPHELAERVSHCGAKHAYVWLWAVDGRHAKLADVVRLCAALQGFGVTPWLWSFPSPTAAQAAAEHAMGVREHLPGVRLVFDWEPHQAEPWTSRALRLFMKAKPEAVTTVPSYARHTLFRELASIRVRLPQLERSADNVGLVEQTLRRFRDPGVVVVPVVGAFTIAGKRMRSDPVRLRGDIERCVRGIDGEPRVPGVAVYSLGDVDAAEAAVLRDVAGYW